MSQKPFAVFDIDGTLIRWQLYHALTDELAKLGYLSPELHETIRTARMQWKQRTHADAFQTYEGVVVQAYETALKSLNVAQLEAAVGAVIEEYKDQVYSFTRDLIAELKAKSYVLFAISGSQRELIAKIAEHYGFDDYSGTDYVHKAGRFTGEKKFYAHDKKVVLDQLMKKHHVSRSESVGVGDSASDIPMLEHVKHPIAFNPEGQLYEHAKKQGWKIVVERKNVVYQMEEQHGQHILVPTKA